MIESLFYAILAILGLGVLIFIHELGHYIVARRQGMRVEAFAIGFGKPIFTWTFQKVQWHLCILPFGGYVKIAGMQKEKGIEPSKIPDGFYGKKPVQRIWVALAGPLVNIVFALVVFTALWVAGGRDRRFTEFTHRIGWVDPTSALYAHGVRPGDVIQKYDGRDFHGFKDLMIASVMNGKTTRIEGYKVDYVTGERHPFDYTLATYEDSRGTKEKLNTIGIASPAQYLVYDPNGSTNSLQASGLEPQDRFVWVDGEVVFSAKQLSALVNDSTAFLTVKRGETYFQTKVPRVHVGDLKVSFVEKGEMGDWQHEAGIKSRFQDLFFIPYNLSPDCVVEGRLSFIDGQDQKKAFEQCERCSYFQPMQEGDQIVAIDGTQVHTAYDLLSRLQTRHVLAIVDRDPALNTIVSPLEADAQFDQFNVSALSEMVASIGTNHPVTASGNLHLLAPLAPKALIDLPLSAQEKAQYSKEYAHAKMEIEKISDPQKRSQSLHELEQSQKKLVLGIALKDRDVRYNPSPLTQFTNVFEDTWRTFSGLFSGSLSPKYISGPVGIVHVVHHSWMVGVQEAFFWLAIISLNLGIVNLLPIPVLDGGHIVFALYEIVTKRRLSAKAMERMVVPFIGLLIGFFIYITYQDLARLFSKFL
jgi:regulator of sigma E protease